MNAHQRRKAWRRIERATRTNSPHYFIRDWNDLAKLPESKTYRLEINPESGNGWIHRKDGKEILGKYLSTHTFYGLNYKRSTLLLRRCGFNVTLANWDQLTASPDPLQTEDYQHYLSECAKHCTCDRDICESVLAGGPCDDRHDYHDDL